jgi:thiol:disulfide interchange protein/DsbC/DsbD-like thiol-disulfide interchange protein
MKRQLFYLLTALLFSMAAFASDPPVQATLIPEEETIQPGHPFWVAIQLKLDNDWHAYWKNPGDAGMAIEIEWQLPTGFVANEIKWPYPQRFDLSSMVGYGYTGEVWLLAQIIPPNSLVKKSEIEISATVNWLVCSDETCLPGDSTASTKMIVEESLPLKQKLHSDSFENARSKIPTKEWSVSAQRKEGLIELKLQPSSNAPIFSKAEFFPEHKNVINPKVPPLLNPDLTVILKNHDQQNSKTSVLKGVIVLRTNSADAKAIEIDVPIKDVMDDNSIAYIDPSEEQIQSISPEPNDIGQFDGGIGLALILAFAGGLLLNLMPCVLPVISFKILSFVKMAGQSRTLTMKHGIAFSSGVIFSFWLLASIMLILQAYGRSVGWGFQLQEPLFVAFLAALLLIFGLSMFGVFELGTSVTNFASKAESQGKLGLLGSFLSGMLATAVATPCTGPFLGSAIGFAVTLPSSLALLIFTSLGLGMASPYLLLAAYPNFMRFIPKPGQWMVIFKEVMGFLMLGTVLWLVWVFGAQTSSLGIILLLSAFFFLSLGCWVFGTWGAPVKKKRTRLISYVVVLLCFSLAGYIIVNTTSSSLVAAYDSDQSPSEESIWQPFSTSKIADLQKKGIPVFVDFTAKWCLICQANHLVLTTPEVANKFAKLGVVLMKADWTKNDPQITQALRKFGRNGVPLYIIYNPDPTLPPSILPQVLTPDVVLKHLDTLDQQIAESKND